MLREAIEAPVHAVESLSAARLGSRTIDNTSHFVSGAG
jgi:hypothetical protein